MVIRFKGKITSLWISKYRKRLFAGGPPANKNLFAGGPPENKNLFAGGPPANKKLFAGGLPANKTLFARALLIKLNSFKGSSSFLGSSGQSH